MDLDDLCFVVDIILADKQAKGIGPIQVDMHDLLRDGVPSAGLLHKMRQLVKMGRYRGSTTINGVPILMRKEKE